MPGRDPDTLWLPGIAWGGAALAPEPEDAWARRRALHPDTSFLVQAPAGSGKTELLIQRFLVLLARVTQPEAIVAITFTVKAAAEMRGRVLDALRRASLGVEPSSPHERASFDLAQAALAQDARLGWNLLNNPGRLRIRTIDALSMSIARQMPWLSRFGAMPAVTDDARQMYRLAAGRSVELLGGADQEAARSVACLLEHLDNDVPRAVELLARMLETRDHWLRVMGAGADPAAVRRELERSLQNVIAQHLRRLQASVPDPQAREMVQLVRFAAGNVAPGEAIAACAGLSDLPDCVEHWTGVAALLLTAKGEWRKAFDYRVGFPRTDRAAKNRCDALMAALAPHEQFRALLAAVPGLPSPRYDESQWEVLSALFGLLPKTVAQLRAVFTEAGVVDFVEIAQAARQALGPPEQPTDLALAMGSGIEHLLVDEFQDTSLTQFDLLLSLVAPSEAPGRTLFLVGDPMQSIYRFRQAEVALFLNVRDAGLGAVRPEPLALGVNFRSTGAVVEWVNATFREVSPAAADAYTGAIPYIPSVAFRGEESGPAVTLHPFLGRDDAAEAALVAGIVGQCLRDHPEQRTAILVRSRLHLVTIAARLRQEGLAYRAIEIQALAEKSVIQDLLALTRALLHLADRLAWLSVLRAPWCGLTLADLHRIAGAERNEPIWTLLQAPGLQLSEDGAARLAHVLPALTEALAARGRVPVSQLVERTWIALGGPALVPYADLEDARAFFDLLDLQGAAGDVGDLELLARNVSELFANPDPAAGGALELMTMHKAKGLEFDTVILPGLGKKAGSDDAPLLLWSERPSARGSDLLLAPIAGSRKEDKIYDFIRREEEAKARHEAQRLLYVACTRARRRLHLLGHANLKAGEMPPALQRPESGSLLAHLWPVVEPEFQKALEEMDRTPAPAGEVARAPRYLTRIRLDSAPVVQERQEPAAMAAQPAIPARDPVGAAIGTVTHRLLERIGREGLEAWSAERMAGARPAVAAALAGLGVPPAELAAAGERVLRAIAATLDDPQGRWILAPHREAQTEFAVTAILDGEVRQLAVDRTFIASDGTRWIVDFKTAGEGDAATLAGYRAQLLRYAAVLSQLDDRPVRVGLYFPLSGGWMEWEVPAQITSANERRSL